MVRYSNWPKRYQGGRGGMILRQDFSTFGIPDKFSSDGYREFTRCTTRFLINWVNHRISSISYPYLNCRAEVVVRTAKFFSAIYTDFRGYLNEICLIAMKRKANLEAKYRINLHRNFDVDSFQRITFSYSKIEFLRKENNEK